MSGQRLLIGVASIAVGVLVVMACVMTWVTMRAVVATVPAVPVAPAPFVPPPAPLPPPISEGERMVERMRSEAARLGVFEGAELQETLDDWAVTAVDVSYGTLERSPDAHLGERVVFSGRVLEIQDLPGGGTFLRLGIGSYGSDPVWVEAFVPPDESVVADSRVRVYGYLSGPHTYTTQAGWNVTIPSMLAVAVVPRRR